MHYRRLFLPLLLPAIALVGLFALLSPARAVHAQEGDPDPTPVATSVFSREVAAPAIFMPEAIPLPTPMFQGDEEIAIDAFWNPDYYLSAVGILLGVFLAENVERFLRLFVPAVAMVLAFRIVLRTIGNNSRNTDSEV